MKVVPPASDRNIRHPADDAPMSTIGIQRLVTRQRSARLRGCAAPSGPGRGRRPQAGPARHRAPALTHRQPRRAAVPALHTPGPRRGRRGGSRAPPQATPGSWPITARPPCAGTWRRRPGRRVPCRAGPRRGRRPPGWSRCRPGGRGGSGRRSRRTSSVRQRRWRSASAPAKRSIPGRADGLAKVDRLLPVAHFLGALLQSALAG